MRQQGLWMNEYHLRDILNLEHPCAFDTLEDYDLLIFRKLITPDDQIKAIRKRLKNMNRSLVWRRLPLVYAHAASLITVRKQGNKEVESYIQRMETVLSHPIEEHNKPRKLPATPLDLTLRLLNNMVDGYLDLRVPLTRRVEFWQQELYKAIVVLPKLASTVCKNMAFPTSWKTSVKSKSKLCRELRDEIADNSRI